MLPVPASLARTVLAVHGEAGRHWLARLPERLDDARVRWGLTLEAPFDGLTHHWVAPATRRDGTPVVLKLGVPGSEDLVAGAAALRLYAGAGAVRLLDAAHGALLLERLEPGTPLAEVEDDDAASRVGGGLMRRLRRPAPPTHPFPTLAGWLAAFGRVRAGGVPAEPGGSGAGGHDAQAAARARVRRGGAGPDAGGGLGVRGGGLVGGVVVGGRGRGGGGGGGNRGGAGGRREVKRLRAGRAAAPPLRARRACSGPSRRPLPFGARGFEEVPPEGGGQGVKLNVSAAWWNPRPSSPGAAAAPTARSGRIARLACAAYFAGSQEPSSSERPLAPSK